MNYQELVHALSESGANIHLGEEQLRISAVEGRLSDRVKEALRTHKSRLISDLRKQQMAGRTQKPILEIKSPEERYHPFPLTDIQQAYWAGKRAEFDLGGVWTNYYAELECGKLDIARLEFAWNRLVKHHDALRTIVLPGGKQKTLPSVPCYHVQVRNLSHLATAEAEQEMLAIRQRMSHPDVPLHEIGRPFEICASYVSEHCTVLHLQLDFMLVDLGSGLLLFQQLGLLYDDPDAELPVSEISFRDYVIATEQVEASEAYKRAEAYWKERLSTLPPTPELPIVASARSIGRPQFTHREKRLSKAEWSGVKSFARRHGVTPSVVLVAAFSEMLSYWSKNQHFTLNLTLFSRRDIHPDVYKILGDFTRSTLLEIDTRKRATFSERAQNIQRQLWRDLDHAEYSGVRVVRDLMRMDNNSVRATMPTVFTCALGLEGIGFEGSGIERLGKVRYTLSEAPQIWFDHQVYENAGELVLNCDTVDQMFEKGVIDAMLANYEAILKRMASEEEAWSRSVVHCLPASQGVVREAYNRTERTFPQQLLHAGFLQQAAKNSNRPAVISSNGEWTYGALQQRAEAIAQWLKNNGLHSGEMVAVIMQKGWEQIAAVLGILLGGGAYVPISPDLPAARQEKLLERTGCKLILSTPDSASERCAPAWTTVCEVTAASPSWCGPFTGPDDVSPEQIAYVIFTSGSTGEPKGVVIDHRGAVNTCLDINERFNVCEHDRVLAVSSLSFDLSVYDIFGILAAGGAVVVPEPSDHPNQAEWMQLVEEHKVTIWNSVPALMGLFVDQAERATQRPRGPRVVMMSGDWIPVELPSRIRKLWPDCAVFSLGGATEASIWSIYYPVKEVNPVWRSIPYGYPLANQHFHVLNRRLEPCPDGVTGDLYIGGIGVAKGYWGDEERTNKSFIIHPDTGHRLYRTGDLGRFRSEGFIEFLGREDGQVKVHGYRIELGEIESALLTHSRVRDAIVSVHGNTAESRRLVAYVLERKDAAGPSKGDDGNSVTQWQRVFDSIYEAGSSPEDQFLNTAGWRDSFTGQLIPSAHMTEWIDATVERIRRCCPLRVLEIGCGTGMVLFRLAAQCKSYVATDISAVTLNRIRNIMASDKRFDHVRLEKMEADQVSQLAAGPFDTIILNSVVQYFPNGEYLERVLDEASGLLSPGGRIFIGDVRHLGMHESFCRQLLQARGANMASSSFAAEVKAAMEAEPELLVSPAFFDDYTLKSKIISGVLCEVKTGALENELNKFRYDVTLVAGADQVIAPSAIRWSTFQNDQAAKDWFPEAAGKSQFAISDVPNQWFAKDGLKPNEIRARATENHYQLAIRPSHATLDVLDVICVPANDEPHSGPLAFAPQQPAPETQFFNQPADARNRTEATGLPAQLRSYLQERLPQYMVPKAYVVLDRFPLSRNGKVDRDKLPPPEAGDMAGRKATVLPRNETERRVAEIWEKLTGVSPIGITDSFFEVGGNSVLAVTMIDQIERTLGCKLDLGLLLISPTIEAIVEDVKKGPKNEAGTSVIWMTPKSERGPLPFFCIHPVGGNIICYRDLSSALGSEIPLGAIQAIGLNGEGAPLGTIEEMAATYIKFAREIQPEGPLHIGGWSLGGMIAFEMARQLADRGTPPALLAMIDCHAPQVLTANTEINEKVLMNAVLKDLAGMAGRNVALPDIDFQGLSEEARINVALRVAIDAGVLPPDLSASKMVQLLAVYRANGEALMRYQPQPYRGDALMFPASKQESFYSGDPTLGWSGFIQGKCDIKMLSGDHYDVVRGAGAKKIAEVLSSYWTPSLAVGAGA